jgi:hypothetical protein
MGRTRADAPLARQIQQPGQQVIELNQALLGAERRQMKGVDPQGPGGSRDHPFQCAALGAKVREGAKFGQQVQA